MRAHVLVGVALLVAGCGDDAGGTAPTPDPPAAPVSIDLTDSQADGILTIDGVDHRFFVDSCVDDPPPEEVAGLLLDLDFEMLGRATIDGRAVTINAFRFDLAGRSQDAYGYFYETRPEEGSTFVKVENEPGSVSCWRSTAPSGRPGRPRSSAGSGSSTSSGSISGPAPSSSPARSGDRVTPALVS